jgi:DNA-binding MarR family transcriptional regulator
MSNTFRIRGFRRSGECSLGRRRVRRVEVSSLDAHIGYWLRGVSNHVSHSFKLKLEGHDVTVAEWVVMRALFAQEGMRPSELAESIGLSRGAISKLVFRLVRKKLVICREDPDDGRAQMLRLSQAGSRLVPKLAALADENDRQMFGHLGARQRALFFSVLKGIAEFHGLKEAPVD